MQFDFGRMRRGCDVIEIEPRRVARLRIPAHTRRSDVPHRTNPDDANRSNETRGGIRREVIPTPRFIPREGKITGGWLRNMVLLDDSRANLKVS